MKDFIARNHLLIFSVICAFALLFIAEYAKAEPLTIDPEINPTATIGCDLPVTREDGTPLSPEEIATITFFRSAAGAGDYVVIATETVCSATVDASALPDGQYDFAATVTDTDGRVSIFSSPATLEVKRLAPPAAPTLFWVAE